MRKTGEAAQGKLSKTVVSQVLSGKFWHTHRTPVCPPLRQEGWPFVFPLSLAISLACIGKEVFLLWLRHQL